MNPADSNQAEVVQSVVDRVCRVVAAAQRIPADTLTADTRLSDLGMDSHDRLTLLFEIETEFDIVVPNEAGQIETIRELADGVSKLIAEKKTGEPRTEK